MVKAPRITEAQLSANQRRRARKQPLEKFLSSYIKGLLETDGWHVFRMEPISRREWGKGTGELGQPDLLALRYDGFGWSGTLEEGADTETRALAQVLWVEVKRKGGKAAAHQTAWHELERKRGALVIVAGEDFEATPEGAMQWYRKSGLMRRDIR